MFDDVFDAPDDDAPDDPELAPRLGDYVIVTALVVIAAISTYRLLDDVGAGRTADAGDAVEVRSGEIVVR